MKKFLFLVAAVMLSVSISAFAQSERKAAKNSEQTVKSEVKAADTDADDANALKATEVSESKSKKKGCCSTMASSSKSCCKSGKKSKAKDKAEKEL